MVIKTFNVNEKVYKDFSQFCKENGISMSKQVEIFMEAQLAVEPKVRQEYLDRLDMIRKGRFIKVDNFRKRYLN